MHYFQALRGNLQNAQHLFYGTGNVLLSAF